MSTTGGTTQPQADVVSSSTGRGRVGQQGGRGERGCGGRGGRHNSKNNYCNNNISQFTGREEQLSGNLFDWTGERNPEQFIRTKDEIKLFFGRNTRKYTTKFTDGIQNLFLADPTAPMNPNPADVVALELWKLECKEYEEKIRAYHEFKSKLYHLVLGQCTIALQEELWAHANFAASNNNGIELLRIICLVTHSVDGTGRINLSDLLCEILEVYYNLRQGCFQSVQHYYECFRAAVNVIEDLQIDVSVASVVKQIAASNGHAGNPNDADRLAAKERAYAIRFVRGSRFMEYKHHLKNSMLEGNNLYPTNLNDANMILQHWDGDHSTNPPSDGIALVTNVGQEGGNNNNNHE